MCGIFGFVDAAKALPPTEQLCRLTNLLRHRGPDGGGYWTEAGVFLGHRRLSIIDLGGGAQPMASSDGRYVITFNGEIYNYPELREELRAEGVVFRTTSDTEVILEAYARWSVDAMARLEGMFAFGLFDRVDRTLLLARDRFGEKPLLYAADGSRIVFASELAPLAAAGVAGREIDLDALGGYLCLNYVPGHATMLRNVRRVAPGHWQLFGPEGLRATRQYWTLRPGVVDIDTRTDEQILDELQTRLDGAVRIALRSDVPVGLFLSGGVDSSIVAQSAARLGRLERAFCVDFAEQAFSEWPRASAVARALDVPITRVGLDVGVLGEFLDVAGHLDDPLADSSAMAVWTVARATASHLKVVLSGDGGDELFGGYLTYPASAWHARVRHLLPAAAWRAAAAAASHLPMNDGVKVGADYKLHRFLRAMPLPTSTAHFTWNGTWLPETAASFVRGDAARRAAATALERVAHAHGLDAHPSLSALQLADVREYLPNDILSKVDRSTMAHGLESRAPLLNASVAELALSLPERLRVDGTRTKVLLRRLAERHFGQAHAAAPKQGFSLPIHRWLRKEGRGLMTSLLNPQRVSELGVLEPAAVSHAVDAHLSGRATTGWELWGLMVLVAWHERRVASSPALPDASDLQPMRVSAPTRTFGASPVAR